MKILNVNTRCYPSASLSGFVEISAVLTEGEVNDYAVYTGEGPPEWVSRHGHKLSEQEARVQFPFLGDLIEAGVEVEVLPGRFFKPTYRR